VWFLGKFGDLYVSSDIENTVESHEDFEEWISVWDLDIRDKPTFECIRQLLARLKESED
jgi:hypothetical protein